MINRLSKCAPRARFAYGGFAYGGGGSFPILRTSEGILDHRQLSDSPFIAFPTLAASEEAGGFTMLAGNRQFIAHSVYRSLKT